MKNFREIREGLSPERQQRIEERKRSVEELQAVVLKRAIPEHGLEEGDVGAVVHVHSDEAVEVEFVSGEGRPVAVVTLATEDVRPIQEREILHVRHLPHS